MLECLVNGEISSFVAADNRGLNYGDGLFDTLLVENGQPLWWQAHMDRLGIGCERLGIKMPQQAMLLREVKTASAGSALVVIKIVLTRQGQARGYGYDADGECDRIISSHPMPNGLEEATLQGRRARICDLRLAIQPALGGIKHLTRLEQVLATAEFHKNNQGGCHEDDSREGLGRVQRDRHEGSQGNDGATEGILLDQEDNVISAISANIFIVMQQRLLTPRLDRCGVRGVFRSQILSAFKSRCEQRRIEPDFLREAHEVFICNSVRGIVPITRIDDWEYPIGAVTREIQNWYLEHQRA